MKIPSKIRVVLVVAPVGLLSCKSRVDSNVSTAVGAQDTYRFKVSEQVVSQQLKTRDLSFQRTVNRSQSGIHFSIAVDAKVTLDADFVPNDRVGQVRVQIGVESNSQVSGSGHPMDRPKLFACVGGNAETTVSGYKDIALDPVQGVKHDPIQLTFPVVETWIGVEATKQTRRCRTRRKPLLGRIIGSKVLKTLPAQLASQHTAIIREGADQKGEPLVQSLNHDYFEFLFAPFLKDRSDNFKIRTSHSDLFIAFVKTGQDSIPDVINEFSQEHGINLIVSEGFIAEQISRGLDGQNLDEFQIEERLLVFNSPHGQVHEDLAAPLRISFADKNSVQVGFFHRQLSLRVHTKVIESGNQRFSDVTIVANYQIEKDRLGNLAFLQQGGLLLESDQDLPSGFEKKLARVLPLQWQVPQMASSLYAGYHFIETDKVLVEDGWMAISWKLELGEEFK